MNAFIREQKFLIDRTVAVLMEAISALFMLHTKHLYDSGYLTLRLSLQRVMTITVCMKRRMFPIIDN